LRQIGHKLCSIIYVVSWIDGQKCRRKCRRGKVGREEGNLSFNVGFGEIV
jgi:hypothetical protein